MTAPIRIAYVSTTSEIGGAEVSLLTLLKGLDRRQFQPLVALPYDGPLAERVRRLGLTPHLLPMETRRRRRPIQHFVSSLALTRWLRTCGASLVHSNSFWAPELVVPAAVRANRPCIYHCRDFYPDLDEARLSAFRKCRALIAISEGVAKSVLAHDPSLPIQIIHNPVDLDQYERELVQADYRSLEGWENARIAGIASRISPEKGQLEFVRAAAKAAQDVPDARFLVVGGEQFTHESDYLQRVRSEVQNLGLSEKIHFTGFIQSMPAVYKAMDVCVLASLREPFGRIVIEAMAAGCAVVATRSGGPQEIITDGENGLLVEPGDVEGMAKAVTDLLQDVEKRTALAESGRELVETSYSLDQVRRVEDLYRRILEEQGV